MNRRAEKRVCVLALTAGALFASAPAMATSVIPIPEPTSMGLAASAIAGAVLAYRFLRRK